MGSGAIYALIIGLWILVLLPIWARRNDELNPGKQVDRFSRAMASLQKPRADLRRQAQRYSVTVKAAPRAGTQVQRSLTAAARRRRVLSVLGVLQTVGAVAAGFGFGMLFAAVPALLIVTFVAVARTQVRAEQARRQGVTPAPVARQAAATTARAARSSAAGFGRALAAARAASERRSSSRSPEQAPAAPVSEPLAAPAQPASWQPVSTPVPSYVTAPAATAVPRAIDAAGGWTGAAMVEAARAMAEAPAAAVAEPTGSGFDAADLDATAEIPVIRITA